MITRLVLNNFRTHAHKDIHFTPGLNGIFGANYTGKTTILYGILYCLGGASAVSGLELQTRGTTRGFEQELFFSCAGKSYRVERGKTKANLFLVVPETGEELLASGTTAVNQKIEEILGLDMKLFKQLKYAQQKNTHALLTLGATGLHKIIDQLTGIDDVNGVIKKLVEKVMVDKGLLEEIGELEDPKETEEALKVVTDEEFHVEQQVDALTKKYETLKSNHTSMQSVLQELRHSADLWDTYQRDKGKLEGSLITYREMENAALQGLPEDVDAAVSALRDSLPLKLEKAEGLEAKAKQVAALEETDTRLTKEVARKTKELAELKDRLNAMSDELEKNSYGFDRYQELEVEAVELKREINTKGDELLKAQEAMTNSVCPACNRPFEEAEDLLSLDKKVKVLAKQVGDLEVKSDEISAEAGKYRKAYNQYKLSRDTIAQELRPTIQYEERGLKVAKEELAAVKAQIVDTGGIDAKKVKVARDAYHTAKQEFIDLSSKVKSLMEVKASVAKVEAAIDQLVVPDYDPQEHDRVITQYKALPPTEPVAEELSNLKVTLAEKKAEVKSLSADLERIVKVATRKAEIASRLGVEKALLKFLRDNRDRFASGIWEKFMGVASTFVSSCTGGALEELRRTEDGNFTFVEAGKEMSVKDASGAQASIMGLGVQIALADSANTPLNVILVDEPTADMDPEHSMATAAMLSSCAEQVIAVSHSQMDSSVCSNVISL